MQRHSARTLIFEHLCIYISIHFVCVCVVCPVPCTFAVLLCVCFLFFFISNHHHTSSLLLCCARLLRVLCTQCENPFSFLGLDSIRFSVPTIACRWVYVSYNENWCVNRERNACRVFVYAHTACVCILKGEWWCSHRAAYSIRPNTEQWTWNKTIDSIFLSSLPIVSGGQYVRREA